MDQPGDHLVGVLGLDRAAEPGALEQLLEQHPRLRVLADVVQDLAGAVERGLVRQRVGLPYGGEGGGVLTNPSEFQGPPRVP